MQANELEQVQGNSRIYNIQSCIIYSMDNNSHCNNILMQKR